MQVMPTWLKVKTYYMMAAYVGAFRIPKFIYLEILSVCVCMKNSSTLFQLKDPHLLSSNGQSGTGRYCWELVLFTERGEQGGKERGVRIRHDVMNVMSVKALCLFSKIPAGISLMQSLGCSLRCLHKSPGHVSNQRRLLFAMEQSSCCLHFQEPKTGLTKCFTITLGVATLVKS
jgi:hypothetical protein